MLLEHIETLWGIVYNIRIWGETIPKGLKG